MGRWEGAMLLQDQAMASYEGFGKQTTDTLEINRALKK